jgi:hypothetical protein
MITNDEMTTAVLMHPMTPEGAVDLIHTLIRQRNQARRIAADLEAECARRTTDDQQNDDHATLLRNAWRVASIDRDKYQLQNAELLGRLNKLTRQLEQAREIAAILENECANCWGPAHLKAITEVRLAAWYSQKGTDNGA